MAVSRILTLLAIAWFILWACAPTMSVPPARPLAHQSSAELSQSGPSREFGMGGTVGFFPTHTIPVAASDSESSGASDKSVQHEKTWDLTYSEIDFVHFYYRKATADGGEWGWSAQQYFPESMPGAGAYRRFKAIHTGNFWAGGQIEGGWLYAGLRAPISLALTDRFWLTTAPSAAMSTDGPAARVPVGLSLRLHKRIFLDSEIGMSWGYDEFVYAGLNIGYGYAGKTWLGSIE